MTCELRRMLIVSPTSRAIKTDGVIAREQFNAYGPFTSKNFVFWLSPIWGKRWESYPILTSYILTNGCGVRSHKFPFDYWWSIYMPAAIPSQFPEPNERSYCTGDESAQVSTEAPISIRSSIVSISLQASRASNWHISSWYRQPVPVCATL